MISDRPFAEDCAQIRANPNLLQPVLERYELEHSSLGPATPPTPIADFSVTWPNGTRTLARVALTSTTQHRGVRWWFLCPVDQGEGPCHRRVVKLYLPANRCYFGCRHCHDLSYRSCQEPRRKHNAA